MMNCFIDSRISSQVKVFVSHANHICVSARPSHSAVASSCVAFGWERIPYLLRGGPRRALGMKKPGSVPVG